VFAGSQVGLDDVLDEIGGWRDGRGIFFGHWVLFGGNVLSHKAPILPAAGPGSGVYDAENHEVDHCRH